MHKLTAGWRCESDSSRLARLLPNSCRGTIHGCLFRLQPGTPPYKIQEGLEATRSFHSCEATHEARTHADWWSVWVGSEIVERMMIFDPAKGDGGTAWSVLPITPQLIELTRLPGHGAGEGENTPRVQMGGRP